MHTHGHGQGYTDINFVIPELLDRFGYFDPTDGGESHRYALSFDVAKPLGDWHLEANVYALDYQLDLFSNFTYALDSENGDQFE
jgi:hypothetical protein